MGIILGRITRKRMTYDGDGKRRRFEDSAGSVRFVWDGENIRDEITDADRQPRLR